MEEEVRMLKSVVNVQTPDDIKDRLKMGEAVYQASQQQLNVI